LVSSIEGVGGVTVMVVSVGSTKKPWQPTAAASSKRVVNAASSWSFRLVLDMIKRPGERAFLRRPQAAQL
jgi:hypothetical protein